jgi:hypothetical protein
MRAQHAFRQFRARLMDKDGKESVLQSNGGLQDGMHGYFVGIWYFPGGLENHPGATLRVELTNGMHVVTIRLP